MENEKCAQHPGSGYKSGKITKPAGRKMPGRTPKNHSIPIVYSFEQQRLSPTRIKTQLGVLFDNNYPEKRQ